MSRRLLDLMSLVGFEIALSAILAFIFLVSASFAVGTFAFVYQGY